MKLQELLQQKQFQYLHVLNENAELERVVLTVESTETPDVSEYIPPNTLLLMTGMVFKNEPEEMCKFLKNLERSKCSGLAIKLGRFIDELDPIVLKTANELGIPVLQIPIDKTLGEVYQQVLGYLWNNQNDVLVQALNEQQKISNLMLQGGSVKSILQNVALMVNQPVMIVDLFGEIVEYSYNYTKSQRQETLSNIGDCIEKEKDNVSYYVCQKENVKFCVYFIRGVNRSLYYMVVWNYDPLKDENHMLALKQVVMSLELYFYRELYVKYSEIRKSQERLDFFLEQLNGKYWDKQQILSLGEFYGLKCMNEYRFIILEITHSNKHKFNYVNFSQNEERFILIYGWIQKIFEKDDFFLVFPQQSKWRYVCLVQGKHTSYLERLKQIHKMVVQKFNQEILIAQGGIVSSPCNLRNSYSEAERCIAGGVPDAEFSYILNYQPQNMMELFTFVPEREMRGICECTLKSLAYPQSQMEEELRKTLYTYLFCNSSITKTAESMFLHRNTVKYRIKKCEEILNIDLSDMASCFQIQLALLLTEYAQ